MSDGKSAQDESKQVKNQLWAEIAGWYGTGAIVLAYVLVSFDVVSSDGSIYQLLNLTGALGIVVIAAVKGVRQPLFLNIFWAVIALVALARIYIG